MEVAVAVESAAFAHLPPVKGDASQAYKEKIRSLFQNLKNKSNPQLRTRVIAGEITPDRFVQMTSEELKSPERRAEDMQIEKENMDKAMVAREEKSISASLVCGKCHQKRVSYSQAQTRSAVSANFCLNIRGSNAFGVGKICLYDCQNLPYMPGKWTFANF